MSMIPEARDFLLKIEKNGGAIRSRDLGSPSRAEDRMRQKCRNLGFAEYTKIAQWGVMAWRITDLGRAALKAHGEIK